MENTQKEVKKIVFLDSLAGINGYLGKNRDCLFIAMNPSVYSYLKRRDFLVQNTLPYFTNDSHIQALERSRVLVDWLRDNINFVDFDIGIQHAYRDSFIFWTRPTLLYCLRVIEIVSNAVHIHKPEIISAPLSVKRFINSLFIEPEEKYLGYIVKAIAQKKNLKYEDVTKSVNEDYNFSISRLENYIRSLIKFIFKYERFRIWEGLVSLRNMFTKKGAAFFTTKLYHMDELIKEVRIQCSDNRFYFLQGPVIPHVKIPDFIIKLCWKQHSKMIMAQRRLFEKLELAIKKNEELFSYKELSFSGIISQKIKDNIAPYILGLILWSIKLNHFIDMSKAPVFISNGNREDDVILSELCHRRNIPTIFISHGSHIRPKNEYESIEWQEHNRALLNAPFSLLALQSPFAEGCLEIFPSESKIIKTGPLIWGRPIKLEKSKLLFKKIFKKDYDFEEIKIILHAGTPKQGKALRLYVYETPDEYIQALNELADVAERIPNIILIIKFRPQSEIGIEDLKNLVPFSEKVILSVDEPFTDVLGMSDLLVSFSSTTIEEALQNRIPVLLYGGGGRYQHVPAYEISQDNPIQKSAVYHVKRAGELEYALNRILNLHTRSDSEKHLFDPYIYPQDTRTAFADLLKIIS